MDLPVLYFRKKIIFFFYNFIHNVVGIFHLHLKDHVLINELTNYLTFQIWFLFIGGSSNFCCALCQVIVQVDFVTGKTKRKLLPLGIKICSPLDFKKLKFFLLQTQV